ncbi:MAG: hypothetical protein HYV26_03025 [Candidatus Hydrogenedentes bacterium]|nr:hypothetical protein [Candidatus Hydrogenedentota bacterium]
MNKVVHLSSAMLIILTLTAQGEVSPPPAPSAVIPPRPAPTLAPEPPPVQQHLRKSTTAAEEADPIIAQFEEAYRSKGSPRLLILYNRDMEDNDKDSMVKTGKVTGGFSVEGSTSKGTYRERAQGGITTFAPAAPADNAYEPFDMGMLRESFEGQFVSSGCQIVDRDTAVRLHGLKEEEVFAYSDLPETQRAQVAGVREFADILVTVRVEKGTATVRKVSGDYEVQVPRLLVRAISLKDAKVLASATTSDVRPASSEAETTSRVALRLMERLCQRWL